MEIDWIWVGSIVVTWFVAARFGFLAGRRKGSARWDASAAMWRDRYAETFEELRKLKAKYEEDGESGLVPIYVRRDFRDECEAMEHGYTLRAFPVGSPPDSGDGGTR